jgi:hypothetical protein
MALVCLEWSRAFLMKAGHCRHQCGCQAAWLAHPYGLCKGLALQRLGRAWHWTYILAAWELAWFVLCRSRRLGVACTGSSLTRSSMVLSAPADLDRFGWCLMLMVAPVLVCVCRPRRSLQRTSGTSCCPTACSSPTRRRRQRMAAVQTSLLDCWCRT